MIHIILTTLSVDRPLLKSVGGEYLVTNVDFFATSVSKTCCPVETLSGELLVTKRKIRHFRLTKNFAQ